MVTTRTSQIINGALEAIASSSLSKYASRTDAKEVIDEISSRSRREAMDRHPDDVKREIETQMHLTLGEYEAYLLVLGSKFKYINSIEKIMD